MDVSLYKKHLISPKSEQISKKGQFYCLNQSTIALKAKLKLSGTQILVFDLLCTLYNIEEGYAYPSIATIAETLSCDKKTVQNAIKRLEEVKLIVKERRKLKNGGDTSNIYIPYCLDLTLIEFKHYSNPDLKDDPDTIDKKNESPMGDSTYNHPLPEQTAPQIRKANNNSNNKKLTNKNSNLELSDVTSSLTNLPSSSTIIPGLPPNFKFPIVSPIPNFSPLIKTNSGQSLPESTFSDNSINQKNYKRKKLSLCNRPFELDPIYFQSSGAVQKIYDLIITINEDFGFSTLSWRMNKKDLDTIEKILEEETPDNFMKHIIRMSKRIKNPNEPRGISFFAKKYKEQFAINDSAGILVN